MSERTFLTLILGDVNLEAVNTDVRVVIKQLSNEYAIYFFRKGTY